MGEMLILQAVEKRRSFAEDTQRISKGFPQAPVQKRGAVRGLLYAIGPSLLTWWTIWMVFEKVIRGWAQ